MGSDDTVNEMDAQIARSSFRSVVYDGAMQVISDAPVVWKGPQAQEYYYERSLIENMCKPAIWGVGCTLVTFAAFRLGASSHFQQFRRRFLRKGEAPKIEAAPSSPLEQRQEQQKQLLGHALSIPIDLFISITIGISATAFLIDKKKTRKEFERIPGLPGRSLVSETMCPGMVQIYKKTSPEVWDYMDDDTMSTMRTFARNCQRRAFIEEKVRRNKGLPGEEPVSLPFPGFL